VVATPVVVVVGVVGVIATTGGNHWLIARYIPPVRRQVSMIVPFLSPALLSVSPLCRLVNGRRTLSLPLRQFPAATVPTPQVFVWILRCSHDYMFLSRCSSSGMTLRPYFIVPRLMVHVSHILRAPHYSFLPLPHHHLERAFVC